MTHEPIYLFLLFFVFGFLLCKFSFITMHAECVIEMQTAIVFAVHSMKESLFIDGIERNQEQKKKNEKNCRQKNGWTPAAVLVFVK